MTTRKQLKALNAELDRIATSGDAYFSPATRRPCDSGAHSGDTHTPGPWTSGRMFLANAKDRRSGFVVNGPDVEPLPVRICDIRCSPEAPFAVSEANARLIAAAPELLAALSVFVACIENDSLRGMADKSSGQVLPDRSFSLKGSLCYLDAVAAIAKANGQIP
jgi:hypothetical protein